MANYNLQPALDQLVRRTLDKVNRDAYFEAGLRRGLEELTTTMFSAEGIQRAAAAYEEHADASPEDRITWAFAAAIEATEYVVPD